MRPPSASARAKRAFTLLELTVVLAILAVLAGVLTPVARTAIEDSRVTRIVAVHGWLARAARTYAFDTGRLAREYSDDPASGNRLLSGGRTAPGEPGWKGPYLVRPLRPADNPFGARVRLEDGLDGATIGAPGFDLAGAGAPDRTGAGNLIRFDGVPAEVARRIDESLDRDVPGEWRSTGRAEYDESSRCLFLFVLDLDER